MGEAESRDIGATTRSVNVVHYIGRDLDSAAALVAGAVERGIAASTGAVSCLALFPTADDALAFCDALAKHRRDAQDHLVPVTSIRRGARVLTSGSAAIAATPDHIEALISQSKLALATLHTVLMVWPEDALADADQRAALERVMAEVPRNAERMAVCSGRTEELSKFFERIMWRARELDHHAPSEHAAIATLRVFTAHPAEQLRAVRSLLDAFDPSTATLLTFSDDAEAAARHIRATLGPLVQVARGVPEDRTNLAILFDGVPNTDAISRAAAIADELVAVVRPTRLRALQDVAPNAVPTTWTGALANARSAHDALRDEIRGHAGSGAQLPWVPIVEPLLEGLDPVDVAASALALLDRERRKARKTSTEAAAATPRPERVAPDESRRRPTRDDERRPAREFRRDERPSRERSRDERPGRDTRRDDRPGREPKRPWMGKKREDRGDRPPRRDAGEGRRRPDDIERVPRAAREGREWSERGERLRHSRRGPRGGDTA